MNDQLTIFDLMYPKYKITKPIRLVELFSGYGSQALALKYLGVKFEHWRTCEWAIKSIQAYKDIHFSNDYIDYSDGIDKKELIRRLNYFGISSNYNEPMELKQIEKLSENQLRTIFSNIVCTNNLVNIQNVKGEDLGIKDTDKYDYIMTYSFPCQDLSLAGKGKGMSDTSTRSGMLWEVERILSECYELGNLPQILLMENVPQVHSEDNKQDFFKWQLRLEELGYKNYVQDLIATDYGIPQTRNRCFMVSILGDYSYTFPKPIPLKLKLKNMLEENVDEKYYLSDKLINCFMSEVKMGNITRKDRFLQNINRNNQDIANSITTLNGQRVTDTFIPQVVGGFGKKGSTNQYHLQNRIYEGEASISITTTFNPYYKVEKGGKQLNETLQNVEDINKTQMLDLYNRNIVPDGLCQTVDMGYHNSMRLLDNAKIRKLTPRECFRLMGVKDEDYEKCAKNQSDSSLYHLAGDSIVVNVLMAIFKELL